MCQIVGMLGLKPGCHASGKTRLILDVAPELATERLQ